MTIQSPPPFGALASKINTEILLAESDEFWLEPIFSTKKGRRDWLLGIAVSAIDDWIYESQSHELFDNRKLIRRWEKQLFEHLVDNGYLEFITERSRYQIRRYYAERKRLNH